MAEEFAAGRVCAARHLSRGIRNITIAADSLAGAAFEPGADVVVRIPLADGGADDRRYSVWKSSAEAGTLDVCIVQHGLGPGSRWAARCAPGDPLAIARSPALPIALDRAAGAHVLLGDETSIAAAEALIRDLPAAAAVLACFEVASVERRWPAGELVRPHSVRWVERAGRTGTALVGWLAAQNLPAAADTTVYVTGEALLCAMIHTHLTRERGFGAGAIRAMPYWKARPALPRTAAET
jgi:NADPH-dependent ferric siderophore reductase